MSHHHTHGNREVTSERSLFLTIALNFSITIAEIIGGLASGSLALLSDAIHNFSDAIAVALTYGAIRLNKRPRTNKYTFGFKRAEILTAVFNASTLIVISFFLLREAFERIAHPVPVTGGLMLIVGSIGLAANVAGTLLLKRGSKTNLNIRAAYIHLLGDAISSIAVIVGACGILVYRIYWIDPALTILISVYIVREAYEIVRESVDVLMMTSPDTVDLNEIKRSIEAVSGVRNIHHVHVWKLNDNDIHFEAHIEVENISVSETEEIQKQIQRNLAESFEISHTTLQFECDSCEKKTMI